VRPCESNADDSETRQHHSCDTPLGDRVALRRRKRVRWAGGQVDRRSNRQLEKFGRILNSVFVDRPTPGGFGALLTDLTRPLKERSVDLARNVRMSVRSDSNRIHDLAPRLEAESAPAYAIFASDLDDLFLLEPLAYPTSSVSTIGPRPYMRPLRAAPRGLRSGLLVADRTHARTFVSYGGMVEELSHPISTDIGKPNYDGFSGYDEHGNRAYAVEASAKLWREAGWRLLEEHQERHLDYLAIGEHGETIDEIGRLLHPYLARLQRTTFVAEPHGLTLVRLRSLVRTQDIEMQRGRQTALAGRVCDAAWGGGKAVLGLGPVLEAANAQAIDTLVVAQASFNETERCATNAVISHATVRSARSANHQCSVSTVWLVR
jgi:hypothetical protein